MFIDELKAKAAERYRPVVVETPAGPLEVRPLTGAMYEELPDGPADDPLRGVKMLALCVHRPGTGDRAFSLADAAALRALPVAALKPLFDAMDRLNGLTDPGKVEPPTGTTATAAGG